MKKVFLGISLVSFIMIAAGYNGSIESNLNQGADNVSEIDPKQTVEDNALEVLSPEEAFGVFAGQMYDSLSLDNNDAPPQQIFAQALKGYLLLKDRGIIKNEKLTIVDFSVSSKNKRLWVIDMQDLKVVLQSYVAHGRNTGQEYASVFSNKIDSHMSSLGFYKTAEVYHGRNGLSLRLDGLEKGINDNARVRAIVIHGADYASESLVKSQGRLGRSFGCPAVPMEVNKKLIDLIKQDSCLFIYHSESQDFDDSIFA